MKKKIFIGLAVVVGLCAIIIGFFVIKDLGEESKLKKELDMIANSDILNDKIDMTIKTKGDYAVVEAVAKGYLQEFVSIYEELVNFFDKNNVSDILTIENYEKDSPLFTESKRIIEEAKKKINDSYDKITLLVSKEEIMRRIDEKKLDSYYVDFYKELMFDENFEKDREKILNDVEKSRTSNTKYLDLESEIITMLVDNPDVWYIEDATIIIDNNALLKRYNRLINDINSIEE